MKRVILLLYLCLMSKAFGYNQVSATVYRSDGSVSDTQNAINAIPSGGTVEIANGSYTWSGGVQIRKYCRLLGQTTGQVAITFGAAGTLVDVIAQSGGHVEVAGINFKPGNGNDTSTYIKVGGNAQVVLLHDC